MTRHTDIGPELRKLAQSVLAGIDPAVRAAAAVASSAGVGKCQQVWCPVCAVAALLSGEQHPLLTVVADHGVALMDVLRSVVDDINGTAEQPLGDAPSADEGPEPGPESVNGSQPTPNGSAKSHYQPIPVTIQE
ncbi:hypothetical protein MBOU_32730 [Mycobacterium bourgelatii]|uniref:Uncharacterized protein n=1 Tax=Mycobacterium bourgelatii TaxID=1273442 RepID=A0A7I9YRD2_MYCBU|nr:hypothetical protein MBOU_32730 [Mycobacterium bourgelatii]